MVSRKELFLLALVEIIIFYSFLSPVHEYAMCVEPDETFVDTVLICLGWKEKQYICLSAYSLGMVLYAWAFYLYAATRSIDMFEENSAIYFKVLITLRNCVIQILAAVLYYAKLKMSLSQQHCCHQGRSDMDDPSLSDTSDPGWEFLRPHVPLSQMSEEEREIEWKYSHLYMHCVYDHHNTSGFI